MNLRRRFRRLWLPMLISAAWVNRHDVVRWVRFLRRSANRNASVADTLTEARVRAAVSADPLLRRDRTLDDISVDDGVVTLLTNTASWPDPRDQIWRLKRVKGVTDVRSELAPVASSGSAVPAA